MVNCTLFCTASTQHVSQLYTGFGALANKGVIKIKLVKDKEYRVDENAPPTLKVILNDRIKVFYDLIDSDRLSTSDLDWSDIYFKRSYNTAQINEKTLGEKVLPYGLNYPVYGRHDFPIRRTLWSLSAIRSMRDISDFVIQLARSSSTIGKLLNSNGGKATSSPDKFEADPCLTDKPSIIFLARLWDPATSKREAMQTERRYINDMRADCVRKLRKQFGDLFTGGVEPSPFSLENYRDVVVYDQEIVKRKNYLKLMKQSSICITTMGLHGSNGWKLGEYVAGSKAIVTEKLQYAVPGDFCAGENYLEFSTPDECIEAVEQLVENAEMRFSMMLNNYNYYQNYVRPDQLIRNTLARAVTIA
jgi:hypothetical protein